MSGPVSELLLQQFCDFMVRRTGLRFPRERWPDMLRGLRRAAQETGLPGAEACMRRLLAGPADSVDRRQMAIVASNLTVGETYFYREPAVFAALESGVLPPLIARRREQGRYQLRIWCAGCCTGEEPYSAAILLERLIPDIERWDITLLATDINPDFLARAVTGEYREWSFRGTPAWLRREYFARSATETHVPTHILAPRIRRMVTFASLNLVQDVYPAFHNHTDAMDIVLCRNVLMYFDADALRAVLGKLQRTLIDGGWLIVGQSETGVVNAVNEANAANAAALPGFVPVELANTVLFRKADQRISPVTVAYPDAAVTPVAGTSVAGAGEAAADPGDAAGGTSDRSRQRALECYAQGHYAGAVALLAESDARDVPGLALAARACANLGRFDDAERWCAAALEADRLDRGLRYLQASVFVEQGRDEAAEAALRQALYLDQDFVLAHFALGNLHRRSGRWAASARHFTNARELLAGYAPDEPLPDADGLTAGGLSDIIDRLERVP
jgi:chemotaxis protein methyltransferase CheR